MYLILFMYHTKCWALELQAGIKIDGRNINNLRYANDATLMAESEEELNSLLRVKDESEVLSWLKTQHSKRDHGIQSHPFMVDRRGKSRSSDRFSWASVSLPMVRAAIRLER